MNYLIDTHTFLWFAESNVQLRSRAKRIIEDTNNNIYISIASLWEMAIKISTGKLELQFRFENMSFILETYQFILLPIEFEHILKVSSLDFHHRDPFDRVIIAQSFIENMAIVGKDRHFDKYGVNMIW